MNRAEIADLLCDSLEKNRIKINDEFTDPSRIGSFILDNLFLKILLIAYTQRFQI